MKDRLLHNTQMKHERDGVGNLVDKEVFNEQGNSLIIKTPRSILTNY